MDNSVITPEIKQNLLQVTKEQLDLRNKKLLFCAVSGSHIWGLSRPDSDFDLRGIYADSPQDFLGFRSSTDTVEFKVEPDIDGQFYELEKFFRMLCSGNGNMVTQVLSPILVYQPSKSIYFDLYTPSKEDVIIDFQLLATRAITKQLKNYYKGYAQSQRKRAMSERGSKALLYTYREIFSGLHVMKYGDIEFDFKKLLAEATMNNWYPIGLLDKYYPSCLGKHITIDNAEWQSFWVEWEKLDGKLEEEAAKSTLPEKAEGLREECEQLLREYRFQQVKALDGIS